MIQVALPAASALKMLHLLASAMALTPNPYFFPSMPAMHAATSGVLPLHDKVLPHWHGSNRAPASSSMLLLFIITCQVSLPARPALLPGQPHCQVSLTAGHLHQVVLRTPQGDRPAHRGLGAHHRGRGRRDGPSCQGGEVPSCQGGDPSCREVA